MQDISYRIWHDTGKIQRTVEYMRRYGLVKKFKQWYKNLKIRKKVLFIQIIVSMIPVIILGVFAYVQTRKLLMDREKEAMETILHQNVSTLDYTLFSYQNYMENLIWDESLKRAVTDEYENNYQMYLMYKNIIDPMIANIEAQNPAIEQITIYGNNETLYPHGTNYLPLDDISLDVEHIKASKVYWLSDGRKTLELYCKMYTGNTDNTDVIYMKVDYESTFENLNSLFESEYKICLTDQDGNTVFSFDNLKKSGKNSLDGKMVRKEDTLTIPNWEVQLYRPIAEITASARSITFLVIIVVILCIILISCFSIVLSKSVTRPLGNLLENIQKIGYGRLETDINEESQDEIGQVIKSFRQMVERLDYMVKEVYQSKIDQQKYEMKALQNQINPHFLYNSLSLINWTAIMHDETEISEMAQLLSTFYRTTLNKGKNVISIKGEWENTCSYMKIQNMMHSGRLELETCIDENMFKYEILNLILQPLVENAIVHGLDHKVGDEPKKLTVTGEEKADCLLFKVCDNGCGMSEETKEMILTTKTSGYGVQNVHQRIVLYYGEGYGLRYESKENEGTVVEVKIPKVVENK